MTKPALVIFDCDGVLVDSEPISIAVLLEMISRSGTTLSEEEAYEMFLGRSMATISKILHEDYGFAASAANFAAGSCTVKSPSLKDASFSISPVPDRVRQPSSQG